MTALLAPRSGVSMRPDNDKEINLFDDLFDQIVETDLLHFTDTTTEPSSSNDLSHLFELPSSNGSDPLETSPMPHWDSSEETWHKALRQLKQNPASPTLQADSSSIYPESRGKASASDPALFSLDDLFDSHSNSSPRLASSTPTTPTPSVPKAKAKPVSSSARAIAQGVSAGIRKHIRKASISPKMMRPSQYRAGFQDLWTRRLEASADTFNLQLPPSIMPASPPPSGRLMQKEDTNGFGSDEQPYSIAVSPMTGTEDTHDLNHHSNYQLTPLASPALDRNSTNHNSFPSDNIAAAYLAQQLSNGALSALQTPPPTNRLPMTSWGADATGNLDFSFSASPEFAPVTPQQKPQTWWSASSAPQPSPSIYQHSRSSSQNIGFSNASAISGLGISCDSALNSFTDLSMNAVSNGSFSGSSVTESFFPPYTSLMPATHHANLTTTPPSRSPSSSPPPQFHRSLRERRASSKARQQQHQSNHHSGHRRKSSQSSNSAPRQASVGFVNFTPDDSRKILTGVAPSGSSKTKARREKEAAEKRRRLSQAATRAIIEAGGDLTELEREGLLCLAGEER